MHCGLAMFSVDYAMRPDDLAREAEARGFESLFFPEHSHIPKSRKTPWPGGGELPHEYLRIHDPFVALAMAAAVTSKLKIGTGVCLVIQRDTIILAKEVASLDLLSGGRFIFGIGGGWNVEEMNNHGTEFRTRWKKLREQVAALKKIWAEDEPEFHGEFVRFDPIWSWPKPVQKPHPPILLGGHSRQVLRRVVDYCDGWLPLGVRGTSVIQQIEELRRLAEEKGRDPRSVSISVYFAPADPEAVDAFRAAGVERVIFGLPPAGRDQILPLLDRYATFLS